MREAGGRAIEVSQLGSGDELEFEVRVREPNGESRHHVTMDRKVYKSLAGGHTPVRCIQACFRFLLDREPKESILRRFDVTAIARYFPEFKRELPRYLAQSSFES